MNNFDDSQQKVERLLWLWLIGCIDGVFELHKHIHTSSNKMIASLRVCTVMVFIRDCASIYINNTRFCINRENLNQEFGRLRLQPLWTFSFLSVYWDPKIFIAIFASSCTPVLRLSAISIIPLDYEHELP